MDELSPAHPKLLDTGSSERNREVTLRAIVIGTIMCVLIGVLGPFWTFYLHTSTLFLDFNTAGATFLLFVLVVLLNGVLRILAPGLVLTRAELLVITAMMMIASAITTLGLIGYLIPNISFPYYYANQNNQWQTRVWPLIRKWMAPLGPGGGTQAIEKFYRGLKGEHIPIDFWLAWLKPLALWGLFIVPFYLACITLMIVFRKQWVDYEKLTFPIAQVPLELAESAHAKSGGGTFLVDAAVWVGFAIPFLLGSYNALSGYFPQILPGKINLRGSFPIFQGAGRITIYFSFAMAGFMFMVPNRIAFSLWSLNLITVLIRTLIRRYGLEMKEDLGLYGVGGSPVFAHQAMGAVIALVALGFWHSRRHLRLVLRTALSRTGKAHDRDEILSYRSALLIFCLSFAVMVTWLHFAGLKVRFGVIFVLSALVLLMGVTRAVCQGGSRRKHCPHYALVFHGLNIRHKSARHQRRRRAGNVLDVGKRHKNKRHDQRRSRTPAHLGLEVQESLRRIRPGHNSDFHNRRTPYHLPGLQDGRSESRQLVLRQRAEVPLFLGR